MNASRHQEVHFWSDDIREPPCETPDDRFLWSDAIEDVTCEACRLALAGDSGDLVRQPDSMEGGHLNP